VRAKTARRRAALREGVKHDAATHSGVYRMIAGDGAVLYVGKSKRMRARLLGHFRPGSRDAGARVLGRTHRIEWEYTPTEAAALRREHRLIQRDRPEFNVAGKPALVPHTFDRHRQVVRAVTVTTGAVGAVQLNRRYPAGVNLGVARVPAGAVGTVAALGGAMIAKRVGYPRIASGLVDLGVGGGIGTLMDSAATGEPLMARSSR